MSTAMPSYDITRPRFRLSDEHVIVLTELATGQPAPEGYGTARDELHRCGLLSGADTLSVLLLPVMQTLINPVVVLSLEASGRQGTLNHGLIIGQDHVVVHQSWPGEREAEYALAEPRMMVWALANMVGLQQSATVVEGGPALVETTMGTLEKGMESVADVPSASSGEQEREHIRTALANTRSLDEPALTRCAELIGELRSSWRLTAAWRGRDGDETGVTARGFGIWDCGPLGYWHRELPAEPIAPGQVGPESQVRLARTDAKRIWAMITDLLPAENEIRRVER
ncbi:histidine kinase [Streptomyces cyaneofuscatus]|uniref:histidine kinase n=1 Tax=Streptomyces cyaneofuscatus TaxID=66883 RepID=UPI002D7956B9|nr:histidine kinase [Streptomyces cyaneofuscatus]WRO11818.1 histidine kinase [Streptomyces cyaneofuscatus]